MAVIKKDGSTMGLPMNITRSNPIPIDSTQVWYSLEEAQEYAANGATAYVGQLLTVVDEDNDTSGIYVIANTDGDLINILLSSNNVSENVESISNVDIDSIIFGS